MSTIKAYAKRFPRGAREAAKSLSSDNHFAVLALLIEEQGLSFSQIQSQFEDLHQQSLSNILSQLQESGLVTREEIVKDSATYWTKYKVTRLGERVLEGLLDSFEPATSNEWPVIEASGHGYHTADNPYMVTTKTKKKVSSRTMDEASQVGGVQGGAPHGMRSSG